MNVKLLVLQGRPQGKSLVFPPGEYVFGRGAECHIRPNSDWVSRQHCLFKVSSGGRVSVSDLGSRNGTLVNGVRIRTETPLKQGDHIQVGPLVFEVGLEESGVRKAPGEVTEHETAAFSADTAHLPAAEPDSVVRLDAPASNDPSPTLPEPSVPQPFHR